LKCHEQRSSIFSIGFFDTYAGSQKAKDHDPPLAHFIGLILKLPYPASPLAGQARSVSFLYLSENHRLISRLQLLLGSA